MISAYFHLLDKLTCDDAGRRNVFPTLILMFFSSMLSLPFLCLISFKGNAFLHQNSFPRQSKGSFFLRSSNQLYGGDFDAPFKIIAPTNLGEDSSTSIAAKNPDRLHSFEIYTCHESSKDLIASHIANFVRIESRGCLDEHSKWTLLALYSY